MRRSVLSSHSQDSYILPERKAPKNCLNVLELNSQALRDSKPHTVQSEFLQKGVTAPNQNASLLEHYQKVRKHQYETNFKLGHDKSVSSLCSSQVNA
jgi:hypothetical protein